MGNIAFFSHRRPFNSPFECGLRALFILAASKNREMSLQRLVYYDYAITHINDLLPHEEKGLFSSIPFRSSEWVLRRDILRQGLALLSKKGLFRTIFSKHGIGYTANSLTLFFTEHFNSPFSQRLLEHAIKVAEHFDKFSEQQVEQDVLNGLTHWGSEFIQKINHNILANEQS